LPHPQDRPVHKRPAHKWFAAFYDSIARGGGARMEQARRFAAGGASGRVIEIGFGTGLNFDFYDWSRVDHLDACEPDLFMLKRARKRLEALPPEVQAKVTLHDAPAEALPFEDGTFDAAVSTLVLCTVLDPLLASRELLRVLKPGGQARLVEHVRGTGTLASFQGIIQPLWGWTAGGCHLNRNTELAVSASGLRLQVRERFKLSPILPAITAIATRDPQA
jgi:ubiquinone/menaquinone biosynthesis C-methylase UbiE